MLDEEYMILQQYKEIDFLFFLISCNSNITEYEIKQKFSNELDSLNLNSAKIKALLEKLKIDKHIIETGVEFFVNPLSKNFLGYYHAFMEKKYTEEHKEIRERRINKTSIIVNIILAIITLILTIISIEHEFANKERVNKIETMQKELNKFKK